MMSVAMLDFALTALASVVFVVDPLGTVPAYLVMTQCDSPAKRRSTAWKASLAATITLAGFAAVGNTLLHLFGLTLPAFQIAGGLILFLVALDMMRAQRLTQERPEEVREGAAKEDITITPLAIPMLAGPAALSTVTMLMSQANRWQEAVIVYLVIGVAGVVIYVSLRLAEPVHRVLGKTGIHVFSRILGLILAGIAVQFVLNGLKAAEFEFGLMRP
jgi:multiple antibiotic resistance protein